MAVTHTTDAHLVLEIASHRSVILKYHTDDCGTPCDELLHIYEDLSDQKKYADIVFLRIDADENPVAKKFILQKKQPIITLYHKGLLLTSRNVGTKEEIIELLEVILKKELEKQTKKKP
jgi:hypothetical protein